MTNLCQDDWWLDRDSKRTHPEYKSKACIQGDSGGKVNILGGNNIGHCEKKKFL